MTKSKKKTGQPHWTGEWITLSNEACCELMDELGYDYRDKPSFDLYLESLEEDEKAEELEAFEKIERVLTNVRFYLSSYDEAVESLDNAPTSVDYWDGLNKLRKTAYQLSNDLHYTNGYLVKALEDQGQDLEALQHQLAAFIDKAQLAIKSKEGEPRGRKKKVALAVIVNHLRIEFDRYYNIGCDENDLDQKSGKDKAQENFIKKALGFAGIQSAKNIKSYFYDLDDPDTNKLFIQQK